MDLITVIQSQYYASLMMLKQSIDKCPEELWNRPQDSPAFWQIAYHALFYTHLYLQPEEKDFIPWEKHIENYHLLGATPWPPHEKPEIGEAYDKEAILEYLVLCFDEVEQVVPQLDFESGSGFDWLPFGKLELQFYNIRHLMQHTGELSTLLNERAGILIDWIGMKPVG
jgi:hypothetical protein